MSRRLRREAGSTATLWANGEHLAPWPSPHHRGRGRAAMGQWALPVAGGRPNPGFLRRQRVARCPGLGPTRNRSGALARQPAPVYILQFAARRVYWQYQIELFAADKLLLSPPTLEIKKAKRTVKDSSDFEIIDPPPGVDVSFRLRNAILMNAQYPVRHYELFALH